MNYESVYYRLIEKRIIHPASKEDGYVEVHHIIPKSMGGTNDDKNLVVLTGREHFIAHRLLFRIYANTEYESQTAIAYWLMCMCKKDSEYHIKVSSRVYEKEKIRIRRIISESIRGRITINNGIETRRVKVDELQRFIDMGYTFGSLQRPWNKDRHDLPSSWMKGKHHTEETRKKISEKCRGMKLSSERIELVRNRMKGNTYSLGKPRSIDAIRKSSISMKGRVRINNGIINKVVHPEDVQEYLDAGWKLGGKPLSDKHRAKCREFLRNLMKNPECRKKISEHSKGKHKSSATRDKISISKIGCRWFTNGVINKFCYPGEEPSGFYLGYIRH